MLAPCMASNNVSSAPSSLAESLYNRSIKIVDGFMSHQLSAELGNDGAMLR